MQNVRLFLPCLLVSIGLASVASAADKPLFAPPSAWVKSVPTDHLDVPKSSASASVATLLVDSQTKLTPQSTASYLEVVAKAQSAPALQSLGAVSLSWQPDMESLTIHKVNIIRAGKVIDVLKSGPGFTILRRETRLEEATLDGALTATMQIEDLEVGDILDVAYTLDHADPVMKGHMETLAQPNLSPIGQLKVRALWPTNLGVYSTLANLAGPVSFRTADGVTELSLTLNDPLPFVAPKGAPGRFYRGREIEVTDFKDWAAVAALMSPIYADAAAIKPGSALDQEAAKISEASNDTKARAQAALELVQNKTRYVLLALNGGGLTPAAAELTWSRRFGDCKGKTALLLALLHKLGIEAEPALVNTASGDGLDERAPMVEAFDHVLVRATIGGKVYWLDGTRIGDHALDEIVIPDFHWALPIRAAGSSLIRLEPPPLTKPRKDISIQLDASDGLSVPAAAHMDMTVRGDAAVALNYQLSNLAPADVDRVLKSMWKSQYGALDPVTVSAKFDEASGVERLGVNGTATLVWSSQGYEADNDVLGWTPDFKREDGPHKDAPYAVAYPSFERWSETIKLPNQGEGFAVIGDNIDETTAGMEFKRRARIVDGAFQMDSSRRGVAAEFPAAEADKAAARLAVLGRSAIYLEQPVGDSSTAKERAALIASIPKTAVEYASRGSAFLNEGKYDAAIADFDKSISLDASSSVTIADRGLAWAYKGDDAKAQADIDSALKLNSREIVAFHIKGVVAERHRKWPEAITAFSQALAISPTDVFALVQRGSVNLDSSHLAEALSDIDASLRLSGEAGGLWALKAQALYGLGRTSEAEEASRKAIALQPSDLTTVFRAVYPFRKAKAYGQALAILDQAISKNPTAALYLARVGLHGDNGEDANLADAIAAQKLEPTNLYAITSLVNGYELKGDFGTAAHWAAEALKLMPDNVSVLADAGRLDARNGRADVARSEFSKARALAASNGVLWNNVCYEQALANFDLQTALADCDHALKLNPSNASFLDSRAFVLLRLGRNQEARATYDACLAARPELAVALFGRSLAERRLGDTAVADRDRAAAEKLSPKTADFFVKHDIER